MSRLLRSSLLPAVATLSNAISPELDAIDGATNTFAQVVEDEIEATLRRVMDDALDDGTDARAVITGVMLGLGCAMVTTLRYLERLAEMTPIQHDAGTLARIYIGMLEMYFIPSRSRSVPIS